MPLRFSIAMARAMRGTSASSPQSGSYSSHESLAFGVDKARAFLDREGDALEIELRRARPHIAELGIAQRRARPIGQQRAGAGDVADEARAERDGVGATMVARALMTWNTPVRLWMPTAPTMRSSLPRIRPVMKMRSSSCTPSASSASRSRQQNSSPPPSGYMHAGEIEARGSDGACSGRLVADETSCRWLRSP